MKKIFPHEKQINHSRTIENLLWGGQDGLINILGLVLGVAAATNDSKLVLIAGLAATFAESISMAAVAFTSQKAVKQYYEYEKQRELKEIEEVPEIEKAEIREIYAKKGFKGKDLDRVVKVITSDKKVWVATMMLEELNLGSYEDKHPKKDAVVVGSAAVIGSIIPLAPFFFVDAATGIIFSLLISLTVLFIAGATKSRFTVRNWKRDGLEMAAIGTLAAIAGYVIGILLQGFLI